MVERTLYWLNHYRRLKVRYERRTDVHQWFLERGCADLLELRAAFLPGAPGNAATLEDGVL